jgi:hypothetical protein
MRSHLLEHAAAVLRWHHTYDDSRLGKGFGQVVAGRYTGWYSQAREELLVYALLCNGVANFLLVSPEPNPVSFFVSQDD